MYDIERILQPSDIAGAIRALQEDPQAVVIAGGSDVLIKIREGKLAGCRLVSIHGIRELEGVSLEADGTILIRPCTTFTHLENNPIIRERLPMLAEAVGQVGGPQVRNIGTVGGNLCNGVTSADSASTLLCCDALLELAGPAGSRQVKLSDFYAGPGRTVRAHDELLTAIRIAKTEYENFGGHYIKYAQRNAMDIATLGCAARVKLCHDQQEIAQIRLAFGVAAPNPVRCPKAEQLATGQKPSLQLLDAVAECAAGEVNPRTSWRASKEFRLQLVRELSRRAVKQAIENAGGGLDA